jgi:carbon-monoxide dehydrogenase small subunit
MARLKLEINGEGVDVEAKETALLLDVLREGLEMTGTKRGCETSHCGACTVLLDGLAVHSCVVLAARCEGKEITTVEGLSQGGELNELQRLFLKHGAVQCGYCTPGMLMAATALHATTTNSKEIKIGLDGTLPLYVTRAYSMIQKCAPRAKNCARFKSSRFNRSKVPTDVD